MEEKSEICSCHMALYMKMNMIIIIKYRWSFKIHRTNESYFVYVFTVPTTSVRAVLGRQAMLPCDITPMEPGDDVFMVLWFREGDDEGEPIYRWVLSLYFSSYISVIYINRYKMFYRKWSFFIMHDKYMQKAHESFLKFNFMSCAE